jgi:hypothetical protein
VDVWTITLSSSADSAVPSVLVPVRVGAPVAAYGHSISSMLIIVESAGWNIIIPSSNLCCLGQRRRKVSSVIRVIQ